MGSVTWNVSSFICCCITLTTCAADGQRAAVDGEAETGASAVPLQAVRPPTQVSTTRGINGRNTAPPETWVDVDRTPFMIVSAAFAVIPPRAGRGSGRGGRGRRG